jgi:hypothetical protein
VIAAVTNGRANKSDATVPIPDQRTVSIEVGSRAIAIPATAAASHLHQHLTVNQPATLNKIETKIIAEGD